MATCKDCIHFEACKSCWCCFWENKKMTEDDRCKMFKDKARFIELPCKVGDTVYCIRTWASGRKTMHPFEAPDWDWIMEHLNDFGKTIFPTREEVEKALTGKKEGV